VRRSEMGTLEEKPGRTAVSCDAAEGAIVRRTVVLLVVVLATTSIASGMALAAVLNGTSGNDEIWGTPQNDTIYGYGGNDYLNGYNEPVRGSVPDSSSDVDKIYGGVGSDSINPGKGADSVAASLGADLLADGPITDVSKDTLSGGDGADNILSNNYPRTRDVINCGAGIDYVKADGADTFVDRQACEKVVIHNPTSASDVGPLLPYEKSGDPRSRPRFR
jgi:Ca2+-binding RTX toxin-like protein